MLNSPSNAGINKNTSAKFLKRFNSKINLNLGENHVNNEQYQQQNINTINNNNVKLNNHVSMNSLNSNAFNDNLHNLHSGNNLVKSIIIDSKEESIIINNINNP
jgi:hypothetical protein